MYYKIEIKEKNTFSIEAEIEKSEIDINKDLDINDIFEKIKEDINKLMNSYKGIIGEKKIEDIKTIERNDDQIFIN